LKSLEGDHDTEKETTNINCGESNKSEDEYELEPWVIIELLDE
jgi:hypothetical protein